MNLPDFTDEQLEHYAGNPRRDMTTLEQQLAQTLINCRREIHSTAAMIKKLAVEIRSLKTYVDELTR